MSGHDSIVKMIRLSRWLVILGLVVNIPATHAQSGVLEINQTCATQSGCFTGDSAGFPVTIDGSAGRSYRLSSDLAISSDSPGVVISAPNVSFDLSGFEIAGPISCTGSGPTLDCGPAGSNDAVSTLETASHVRIRNGTVRNMNRDGISIEGSAVVDDMVMINNARHGIGSLDTVHITNSVAIANGDDGFDLDQGSTIANCSSRENGRRGFEIDMPGGVIYGSVARANADRGISIAILSEFGTNNISTENGAPDSCGGGICTPKRRFYLTDSIHDGANALQACDTGFHMATLWEIQEPTQLRYDFLRADAVTLADSGEGPPRGNSGWIRTGTFSQTGSNTIGAANCTVWTSSDISDSGSRAFLRGDWDDPADVRTIDPWKGTLDACNLSDNVWCVEDL